MKKYLIPFLVLAFSVTVCYAQINFEVPRGKTVNNFTYTADGTLKYRGKEFSPAVKCGEDVEKFIISFLPEKGLAGAIGVYSGDNSFIFLNTKNLTSDEELPISAAVKMYWSPSRRFLVVYGEYEGAWLYSINVATKKVRQGMNWFPNHMWIMVNSPRWIGKSDLLAFKVVLGCPDPYDTADPCDEKPIYYNVRVDAATMKIKNKRLTKE